MDFYHTWVEVSFIVVLIVGFILSLFINSVAVSYVVVFLCGTAFGKAIYHRKDDYLLPYILLTVGFIIGYLLGHSAGNIWTIIFLFALGNALSYFAHERGLF